MPVEFHVSDAIIWAMLIQAAGSIWWASAINKEVKANADQLKELAAAQTALTRALADHATQDAAVSAKLGNVADQMSRVLTKLDMA